MAAAKATAFTVSSKSGPAAKARPARKGPFKFLRKDEGHRADGLANVGADGDSADGQATPRRVQLADRQFREAIKEDMTRRADRDPFADALVAVPKRPPPQQRAQPEAAEQSTTSHRVTPPSQGPNAAAVKSTSGSQRIDTSKLDDPPEEGYGRSDEAPPRRLANTVAPSQHQEQQRRISPPQADEDHDGDDHLDHDGDRHQPDGGDHGHHPMGGNRYTAQDRHSEAPRPGGNAVRSRNELLGLVEPPRAQRDQARIPQLSDLDDPHHQSNAQRVAPVHYYRREEQRGGQLYEGRDDYHYADQAAAPVAARLEQRQRSQSHQPGAARRGVQTQRYHADPVDDATADAVEDGYENYFPRPSKQQLARGPAAARRAAVERPVEPDEELMAELERKLEEARNEKAKYQRLVADAQKRRDQEVKEQNDSAAELQADREEFERWMNEEKKALRRERKALDEQRKRQTDAATAEREANRRLQSEVEVARDTLERMSVEMRDKERTHKAEADRMRRQIADLQARNDELSEMLRTSQAGDVERAAEQAVASRRGRDYSAPPPATTARQAAPGARVASAAAERYVADEEGNDYVDDDMNSAGDDYVPPSRGATVTARGAAHRPARYDDESRQGINHSTDTYQRVGTDRDNVALPARGASRQSPPQVDAVASSGSRPSTRTAATARAPSGQRQPATVIPTLEQFIGDVTESGPTEDLPGDTVTARNVGTDGKTEQLHRSGKRVITYVNGTRKVVLQSGHVILHFSNGDVKRTFPSGKTTYWYAVAQTTHTQLPDGLQVFQFHSSSQTEKHFPDGRKEILYPEGVYKTIASDGSEITYFPDGSVRHGSSTA